MLEPRGVRKYRRERVGVFLGGSIPQRLQVAYAAAWSPLWGMWWLLLHLLRLGGEARGVQARLLRVVMVRCHGCFLLHDEGSTRYAVDLLELWLWVDSRMILCHIRERMDE